jgi:hypothetical protein
MSSSDFDWTNYHCWIRTYILRNDITINDFLQLCDLPMTSYYKHLCCAGGYKLSPSNKAESAGQIFRTHVMNLRASLQDELQLEDDALSKIDRDPSYDKVDEFFVEHYEELNNLLVANMYLDDADQVTVEMTAKYDTLADDKKEELSTLMGKLNISAPISYSHKETLSRNSVVGLLVGGG